MIAIRPADPHEADALTALVRRSKAHWGYDADFMAQAAAELTVSPASIATGAVFVAVDGDRLLGMHRVTVDGTMAEAEQVFVDPVAMGKGVGRALWDHLAGEAARAGASMIAIQSDPYAEPFYLRMGAARMGMTPSGSIPGRFLPHLVAFLPGEIVGPVSTLDTRLAPERQWRFATEQADAIAAHWAHSSAANPTLYNGPVLFAEDIAVAAGHLAARFLWTDFATMLAWRELRYPDLSALNLFGSAVIRAADGTLLFARHAAHTANAGLIYPPGGSLSAEDVDADGQVDVLGSIRRELMEETGLDAGQATWRALFATRDGPRFSLAAVLQFDDDAGALIDRIDRHRAQEDTPEIAEMVPIARTGEMAGLPVPGYAQAIARYCLG